MGRSALVPRPVQMQSVYDKLSQVEYGRIAMMYWNGEWSWAGWLGMVVLMVAFWGALGWIVVTAVRSSSPSSRESAVEILDRRLAQGELTLDEYRELRRALQKDPDRS